jgi:fatty acid desaturase
MTTLDPTSPFDETRRADLGSRWARWWASALNDPRDVVFVNLSVGMTATILPAAFLLFWWGQFSWLWAAVYWIGVGAVFMDRFILMLHCTSHRPLFNKRFRPLNSFIPWVLGPFVGQTPETYFVHHLGMHHKEGNLGGDLSSTMPYQRDRLSHWLRYWARFMVFGLVELTRYQAKKGRTRMVRRLLIGEGSFWLMCALLGALVSVQATLVVFVIPVVIVRTLMMAGNWGQHAFVCPDEPDNDFRNSITCINTRYNRRCFNDGYHIIHHLKPNLQYTEMADEFERHRERYGAEDAIVFDGYDFFQVWLLLMTGRHQQLARAFVRLPGAPERTEADVLALLRHRTRAFV